METHEKKYIGCTGKEDCIVCKKVEQPGYELVRLNLSLDRVGTSNKELLPIQTPIPIPQEVRELLERFNSHPNSSPEKKISLKIVKSPMTCLHSMKSTTNKVICPSCCGGQTKLKIFKCEIYTSCIADKEVVGIKCCLSCDEYISK